MKGKGVRRAAAAAAKHWRHMRFGSLTEQLSSPLQGELRLPLYVPLSPTHSGKVATTSASSPAHISLQLSSNSEELLLWWTLEHFPFFKKLEEASRVCNAHKQHQQQKTEGEPSLLLASNQVNIHAGPPNGIGYPKAIELEVANWAEGVFKGEAYAYHHLLDGPSNDGSGGGESRFLSPVRWINQVLLDGFVSRRLDAHAGVTTAGMLHARQTAARLGKQLPVHELSPYYAADHLLGEWCLFGEPDDVIPRATTTTASATGNSSNSKAQEHLRRVAHLALASAVLPAYQGVWLNAAVVAHRHTGESVMIVGPQRCGKTTLALHCLTACPELMLTASEDVFVAAGSSTPLLAQAGAAATAASGGRLLFVSMPGAVEVGLGAVLGTLHPNSTLAAHVRPDFLLDGNRRALEALLRNPEGVLWDMSQRYLVHVAEAFGAPQRWCPAVLGPLKAVVLLDWDVEELQLPHVVPHTTVSRGSLLHGGLDILQQRLVDERHRGGGGGSSPLLRGHYLLRSLYDEAQGFERLVALLEQEYGTATQEAHTTAPELYCVTGSVSFSAATKVVCDALTHR